MREPGFRTQDPGSSEATLPNAGEIQSPQRRRFMVGSAGLTFGVAGVAIGVPDFAHAADAVRQTVVNPWVTLSTDGTVYIMSPATEMGQGSLTAIPVILADGMDADWSLVTLVAAPPDDKLYGNPRFANAMYTAGSATVTGYFTAMRQFGAQVRTILVQNAAERWNVPVAELTTLPGVVLHEKSGRRLSYGEIAGFMKVPEKAPDVVLAPLDRAQFRLVGRDLGRVDVPGKTDGTARYSIDVQVPGMIYGAILREPMEGAAPERVDDAAARAMDGVIAIVPLKYGVGVLADTPWTAFKAKNALQVTWSRKATAWGYSNDKGYARFAEIERDPSRKGIVWETKGDVHAAMKRAASTFEAEYRADYAYHGQMEPLNSVAAVSPAGDSVEIWCGTQSQTTAVAGVAAALGIAQSNVKFNGMLMGGGFGRRGHRDVEFIVDSALMSKAAGRPVKVIWTREDDVRNGRFRPLYVNKVRAGLDESGKIIAWHHRVVCDRVLAFMDPVRYSTANGRDNIAMRGTEIPTYDMPDRLAEGLHEDTGIRTAPLRAIGVGQNAFANEVFMDEIAARLEVDPVQFRLRHLTQAPRAKHVIEAVARMAGWGKKRDARGLGFAYLDYSGTQVAGVAEVSVDRASGAIKVHRFWCAIDAGIAVQPDNIVAQTESSIVYGLGLALTERIEIENGAVKQSNFYDYHVPRMKDVPELYIQLIQTPNHPTGAGQMATPLIAPAISNAVYQLTGARLRQQPMLPERVLSALREAQARSA